MARLDNIKASIDAKIRTNGQQEITGQVLNTTLNEMVDGVEAVFAEHDTAITEQGEAIAEQGTKLAEQDAKLTELAEAVELQGTKTSLNEAEIGQLKDSKADKEGYYSSLVAGAAENLINTSGDGVVREFTYDTAGGTADIGTGTAIIKGMRGKSLVWNQLKKDDTFKAEEKSGVSLSLDGQCVVLNGTATSNIVFCAATKSSIIKGHQYLIQGGKSDEANYNFFDANLIGTFGISNTIFTAEESGEPESQRIYCANGVTFNNYRIEPLLIDLTQMFGAGNEPATIEEFKRLFPRDDYAYNAGEVIHFNGRRLLTTGFNQWDEQWELGRIDVTNGNVSEIYDSIRSKNFTKVFPNTKYYGCGKSKMIIVYYDEQFNFVDWLGIDPARELTIPANVRYVKFMRRDVTTYDNDFCFNLCWSGYRNGEYEPYEEHILELPYGVYGDGLKSVGDVYDEVTEERYVKRIGVVDMGSLAWSEFTTMNGLSRTQATIPDFVGGVEGEVSNILCAKFATIQSKASMLGDEPLGIFGFTNNRVFVLFKEGEYADATSFKAAMSGVMLYYELAEPEVTEFKTPLNLGYYVNDFGTEMILPENGIAPFTAPAVFDILYAMNAVDTLRNLPTNYISKESFDNFTAALSSALANAGITMSIRATFNEETGAYTYTITASKTE